MNSGSIGNSSNGFHLNNRSGPQLLGDNECERVRIIRECAQMNSQQRNNRELVRDGGAEAGSQIEQVRDGLVVAHPEIGARRPIYRLCGRQTLLDLLQRADCERKEELQGLLEQKPVSEFTHRNRIQAFIRGRLLRNKIVIANERPSSMAASELGLLRQRHTVSGLSCLAGSLVEQLWNFAWPAAIALIHRSFLPVEVIGFFTKLGVIVGGPLVGKLMDYFPRVHAYNCLTVIQVAAQLLSAGMIIHAHTIHPNYVSSVLVRPWFAVLVITLAVERLSGLALGVAMERDWVVLLAGTNRPIALAQANAILSRIDLPCEMAGASLFGIFLSKYETVMCLKLAARLMMWSLPVLVVLTWLTSMLSAGVLGHAKCPHTDFGCLSTGSIHDAEKIFTTSIEATKHGWFEYIQQPVLPASLAYVLLYFNVALAPGGLMTAFLTQHDVRVNGAARSASASPKFGTAFATGSPLSMKARLGISRASHCSQWFRDKFTRERRFAIQSQ